VNNTISRVTGFAVYPPQTVAIHCPEPGYLKPCEMTTKATNGPRSPRIYSAAPSYLQYYNIIIWLVASHSRRLSRLGIPPHLASSIVVVISVMIGLLVHALFDWPLPITIANPRLIRQRTRCQRRATQETRTFQLRLVSSSPMNLAAWAVVNGKRDILKPESHFHATCRFAFLALLSVAVTVVALRVSMRHGRLALPLTFDDIVYFLDAGQRLQDWHDHGIGKVLHGLATRPLHSPYSTFEALFSFMIFGMRDWAPYLGNAALVAGFFFLADRLTSRLRLWHKA
jgi:hypothetical protein